MHPLPILLLAVLTAGPPAGTLDSTAYHVGATTIVGLAAVNVVGDGHRDLLTVARSDLSVRILPGTSGGGFAPVLPIPAANDARRAAAGDVNGDGIPDLLVIGHDNTLDVRLGIGGGAFGPVVRYGLRNHGNHLAVVDLNHDGFDDVVAVHDGSGQPVYVTSFLGSATGDLHAAWELGTIYFTSEGIALGDFDGDGKTDAAVAVGDNRASALVFRGLGTGAFEAPVVIPTVSSNPQISDGTTAIAAGDLDDDGRDDLVLACFELTNQIVVRRSTGSGFTGPDQIAVPSPVDVKLGDVDGDGHLDAVASNLESGALSLLYGKGDGSFVAPIPLPAGPHSAYLAVSDFDGDGHADIAVTDLSDDTIRVLGGRPVSVPPGGDPGRLHFALVGSNPVRSEARFRFDLPVAGQFRIDVFDVAGRRAADPIEGSRGAGPNEVAWTARELPPGILLTRLTAAGEHAILRLVLVP